MTQHTYDSIIRMIREAPAGHQEQGVFTCDPATFSKLSLIQDKNGKYILEEPFRNDQPWRMFGFPVFETTKRDELTFAPEFSELGVSV